MATKHDPHSAALRRAQDKLRAQRALRLAQDKLRTLTSEALSPQLSKEYIRIKPAIFRLP